MQRSRASMLSRSTDSLQRRTRRRGKSALKLARSWTRFWSLPKHVCIATSSSIATRTAMCEPKWLRSWRSSPWPSATAIAMKGAPTSEMASSQASWRGLPDRRCDAPVRLHANAHPKAAAPETGISADGLTSIIKRHPTRLDLSTVTGTASAARRWDRLARLRPSWTYRQRRPPTRPRSPRQCNALTSRAYPP